MIYPTLQALEDQDFVRSAEQDGKKVYSITEAGLAYLRGTRRKRTAATDGAAATHGEDRREPAAHAARGRTARTEPAMDPDRPRARGASGSHRPRQARPGAPGSPRVEARSSCGRCAGCSATSRRAMQRTLGDPEKLKEIREVLREAKAKIDEIVMR